MKTTKSEAFLHEMSKFIPGGANSNARCGSSIAIASGKGAELSDLDGNRYIDYILGFGPMILGHAHPQVSRAVSEALNKGTSFAFSHELELKVAEHIVSACPSIDMVRLCNSGTDAAITAHRIACAYTGRKKTIKIQGDYNGGYDVLLHDTPGVDAKSLGGKPNPGGLGIPDCVTDLLITVPFNDAQALKCALETYPAQVAAVFMEPILGNTASIMPMEGYLEQVRSLCSQHGVVLVFDEVKTGFRVAPGGAQAYFGIHSDLTMLGKALANGLPLAAIGGRRELMELVRPGGVHHCGTYFGNVPCVAAANMVLSILKSSDYKSLMQRGAQLAEGICELLAAASIPSCWHGVGSMFGITIGEQRPRDYKSWWMETDRLLWMQIAKRLQPLGVLTDGFIGLFFLSFAHTEKHIERTLMACEDIIREFRNNR